MEQGLYLNDISESLEKDTNTLAIEVPVGSMLLINNSFWLHGRDKIKSHKLLSRELLRQRGVFDKNNRSRKSKNLWRAK